MNSLTERFLMSILRHVLTLGAGALVARGYWTDAEAAEYVAAGALFLAGLGWALWQKYKDRLTFLAAKELPPHPSGEAIKVLAQSPRIKAQAFDR